MFTNGLSCLKEPQNSIQNEDKSGRFTMASTPETVDSVNLLLLADRGITIEDVF